MKNIAIIILSLVCQIGLAQHVTENVDSKARKAWIKQTVKEYKDFNPSSADSAVEPHIFIMPDVQIVSYKIKQSSLIRMSDDSWIYLIPHSAHEDPSIGDICLAKSSTGIFYINTGHICGGVVHYRCNTNKLPASTQEFFGCYLTDTDDQPWILLKEWEP